MNATGILIDPNTRTVTEVQVQGDFTKIQELIDARCFTTSPMVNPEQTDYLADTVFVDDEGLLFEGNAVWKADFLLQPLCGKGLIMGTDTEGESITPAITVEEVRQQVQWTNMVTTGM